MTINVDEYGYNDKPEDIRSNKENTNDDRRVLLAITVEIEDGCVEHIEMREGDSAEAVATKFCRDHSLPDQFVAPLTEHIVSNIVNISTEDKELIYYGKDERVSSDHSWVQEVPKTDGSRSVSPRHDYTSDQENRSARSCGCKQKTVGVIASAQDPDKSNSNVTQVKNETKTRRRLSERLLAPTLTSLAKRPQAPEKDKNKELGRFAQRPISERAKAVYMRLYAEFLRQKQRIELDKARNLEIYQEKIERDRAFVSKRSWRVWRMRGRTAKQYRNYGELLYSEGISRKEQLKKQIVQKQHEDEVKELKELTLKPEISKRAKQIRRDQGQIWHRLQTPDKPRQDQLQELRNEIWEAKLMECTFKPRINQRRFSEKLLHDGKDSSTSRFDQLFLDAENRRRRQAEYMQWYPEGVTFRPHINRHRQSHGLDMDDGYHQEGTVFDRLLHYASKLVEKKQMWQQMASKQTDPATGQELFTPVTGRKPIRDRNTGDLPIGDFLYQLKNSMERKKQWLATTDLQNKREQASCQYVGPKSQKLLDGIKERRFQQIFDHLDQDKDGYVELETADLNQLADDVVDDVVRLKKLGGGKVLNFQAFVDSMKAVQVADRNLGSALELDNGDSVLLEDAGGSFLSQACASLYAAQGNSSQEMEMFRKYSQQSRNGAQLPTIGVSALVWASVKFIQEQAHKRGVVHLVLKHKRHDSPVHRQFKMDRYSRNLAGRRRRFNSSRQWYKLILADRAKWLADIEAMRKERQSLEMKECTFRPEIQKKRAQMKVCRSSSSNEPMYPAPSIHPHSKILEKQQRELHGFIFQEDGNRGPERLENTANDVAHGIISHVESPSNALDMNPMGLLESLKSLKQIVAQSVDSSDEVQPQPYREQDVRQDMYYGQVYQNRVEIEKLTSSTVNDLPDPEGQKEGLFMGLMGA